MFTPRLIKLSSEHNTRSGHSHDANYLTNVKLWIFEITVPINCTFGKLTYSSNKKSQMRQVRGVFGLRIDGWRSLLVVSSVQVRLRSCIGLFECLHTLGWIIWFLLGYWHTTSHPLFRGFVERLNRAVAKGAIASAVIFSILPKTPSRPVDLVVSIDFNSPVTSLTVQSKPSGQVCTWLWTEEMIGGILWLKHSESNQLRYPAFSTSDKRLLHVCPRAYTGIH